MKVSFIKFIQQNTTVATVAKAKRAEAELGVDHPVLARPPCIGSRVLIQSSLGLKTDN